MRRERESKTRAHPATWHLRIAAERLRSFLLGRCCIQTGSGSLDDYPGIHVHVLQYARLPGVLFVSFQKFRSMERQPAWVAHARCEGEAFGHRGIGNFDLRYACRPVGILPVF